MAVPRLRVPSQRPAAGLSSDEVELYHRTYTTLLRSSGETLAARARAVATASMNSSLHPLAASEDARPRRLPVRDAPAARRHRRREGDRDGPGGDQSSSAPASARSRSGTRVEAPARRRRWFDDGEGTLAVLLASTLGPRRPDPDARRLPDRVEQAARAAARGRAPAATTPDRRRSAPAALGGAEEDWSRLRERLGRRFAERCARSASAGSTCASGCSAAAPSATRA